MSIVFLTSFLERHIFGRTFGDNIQSVPLHWLGYQCVSKRRMPTSLKTDIEINVTRVTGIQVKVYKSRLAYQFLLKR